MASGRLEVLSTDECLSLLDQAKVGRVGVSTGASPEVFPVVYRLLDGAIVFRTGKGQSSMPQLARPYWPSKWTTSMPRFRRGGACL